MDCESQEFDFLVGGHKATAEEIKTARSNVKNVLDQASFRLACQYIHLLSKRKKPENDVRDMSRSIDE